MDQPVQLTKLRIREISGVDDPASEYPDWIVAKAKDFKREVQDIEKAIVGAHALLESDEAELYFQDAPEEVRKARATVADYIDEGLEVVDGAQPQSGIMAKVADIFGFRKDAAQPIIGAPGETRRQVERVTPAETSSSTADRVTEDQGKDELGRDADGKKIKVPKGVNTVTEEQYGSGRQSTETGDEEPGRAAQPIVGAPGETRREVDRVTPAEAGTRTDRVTEDQGKDELGRNADGSPADLDAGDTHVIAADSDDLEKAKIVSAFREVLQEELDPLREAIGGLSDRTEDLEKNAAASSSLYGQDGQIAEEDDLASTFRKAARGARVTLR